MNSSREVVLERIRRAKASVSANRRAAEYEAIPRTYCISDSATGNTIEMFVERLEDYGSTVYRCQEAEIAQTIARVLAEKGKRKLVVPAGLSTAWMPGGFDFVLDGNLSYDEINAADGVITGCAMGIAWTGTLILAHSEGEGRRAITLIPDYHLCIVFAGQLVETVAEAIRGLAEKGRGPLTTVSGSSATSDIEMTRVKGVHGPRTLDVILVGAPA